MYRIYLFLILASFTFHGFGQNQIKYQLGSKSLYRPQQLNYTPVPKGYKAVFINFIARHGARHVTKDIKISFAWNLIKKADSTNMLLPLGLELQKKISNLNLIEEKNFGSITQIGRDELAGIAKRLYLNQKNVFAGSENQISISTTKKGRTKESAEAFLASLITEKATLNDAVKFNYADDDHLRFYDFSKTYDDFKEGGNWTQTYKQITKAKKLPKIVSEFSAQFFKSTFLDDLTLTEKTNFLDDIYGFYTILGAIDDEIKLAKLDHSDLNFEKYFSATDLVNLRAISDAEDFLVKGPGVNVDGIQVRIAAPLLVDFLNSTNRFFQYGKPVADFRFAHAETIAPFAAIMDIRGASESSRKIMNFDRIWQAEKIIPFSANIQWIFYKTDSNSSYLVKFLFNEKEEIINGLETKTFPYYKWEEVSAFYLKKLKMLKINLEDNMHKYLLDLK